MSTRDGNFFQTESTRFALQVDRLADEFEAAWNSGRPPRIPDFLAQLTGEARLAALEELVRIDQAYRARHGKQPGREEYRLEFPELPASAPAEETPGVAPCRECPDDKQHHASPATNAALPELPGYELIAELGRGSMGVVYQARQKQLQRIVAVKMVLSGAFAGPEQLGRFRAEAQSVARLQHPHIVQIYEVGEFGGLPYLALEHIDGSSLASLIQGCPQPPRQAAELMATVALAVHEAHRQGIVHRDLTPSNILLTSDGRPKVADFGLAKQLDVESGYTQSGIVIGTPSYMSPEQAAGRLSEIGPASDVYALGAILYEMLTGRPPYRGATMWETLEQVRRGEPVPPTSLQPRLPGELETICLKAMAGEPTRRYATAEALADDLRRWLEGNPIHARPAGPLEKLVKWSRRRPASAALAALAMAAAAAAVGGGWWHTAQLQSALDQTEQARRQADTLRAASEQDRERAEAMVYATDMQLASAAYSRGEMFEVERRLKRHLPAPAKPDRRDFTWRLFWALGQPDTLEFRGHDQDAYVVRVVNAGRQLVSAGRDGTLRLWEIGDPTRGEILGRFDSEVNFVAVAPDGIRLATGSDDGTVRLWNLATRTLTNQFKGHGDWVLCGAISPSGDRLATGGRDNIVRLWTLAGERVAELKGHESTIEALAFLPDGRSLVSAGTDGTLRRWDVASAAGSVLVNLNSPAYSVCASHDGKLLAIACEDHAIYLCDAASGALRGRLIGHDDWVQCVEFSPDDTRLASACKDGSVRVWDVARVAQIESIGGHVARAWSVAWLPDGSGLASSAGDGTVRVWRRSDTDVFRAIDHDLSEEVQQVALLDHKRCCYRVGHNSLLRVRSLGGSTTDIRSPLPHRPYLESWSAARNTGMLAIAWSTVSLPENLDDSSEVMFYDSASAQMPFSLKLPARVASIALAPDGRRLAVTYRNERIEVFELPSLQVSWSRQMRSPANGRPQFTFDGSEFVARVDDENAVDVYAVADGRSRTVIHAKPQNSRIVGLALGPNGRTIATGDVAGSIRIWDFLSADVELVRQAANDGQVSALAFTADGRTLATGTVTGAVTLWDTATWQPLARFATRLGKVLDLCFAPDGNSLAVSGVTPGGKGQVLICESDHSPE